MAESADSASSVREEALGIYERATGSGGPLRKGLQRDATLRRRLHAGPVSPPDRDRFDACIVFVVEECLYDMNFGSAEDKPDSFWRHFTTWNVRYQAVLGFCAVVRRGSNASSTAGEAEKEEL